MKTIKSLLLSLISITVFASCSNDDSEAKTVQYYDDCFHHVYNVMSGEYKIFEAPQYEFEFNYTDITANVKIKNVKFADGMPAINMTLENLKWNISNGFKVINANNVIPVVDGNAMPEYMLNSVKIELLDRYVGVYYEPIVNVYFVINDMCKVTAVQEDILYFGETSVTSMSGGNPYTINTPVYQLSIDEDMIADLKIAGAKFAQGMPSLDMEFENIPVEISSGVGYTLKCESLIPEINDVPFPNYQITNLIGMGTFSKGLDLSFNCVMTKTMDDGSVVELPPYKVDADLHFEVPAE